MEYQEVDLRVATIAFEEIYHPSSHDYTLEPQWHFPLTSPDTFQVAELATFTQQIVNWSPPNGEQNFGTGDWNRRLHAFDFGCSSVDLDNGQFLRMAAGEYTLQTSGPDRDTYDVDVYGPSSLRSDREGVHQMFAPFAGSENKGWRWQRQGE